MNNDIVLDDIILENPDGIDIAPIMGELDIEQIMGDIEAIGGEFEPIEIEEWDRSQFARDAFDYEEEVEDDSTNFLIYGGIVLIAVVIIVAIIAKTRKK